jgi:hypothetical protein
MNICKMRSSIRIFHHFLLSFVLVGETGTDLFRFWNFVDSYVNSKKNELVAPPSTDDQWKNHVWKMVSSTSGMTCKIIPEIHQSSAVQSGTGRKGKGKTKDGDVEVCRNQYAILQWR